MTCSKCGLPHRITVYRREPLTYLCATCVGEPVRERGPRRIRLNETETRTLERLLEDPPEPTPALRRAFEDRKKAYQGFRLPHDPRFL